MRIIRIRPLRTSLALGWLSAFVVLGSGCPTLAARLLMIGDWPEKEEPPNFVWEISQATGLSGDGSTVIGKLWHGPFRGAFHWTESSGFTEIGDLYDVPGGGFSWPNAVSGDGKVIVGSSRYNEPPGNIQPPPPGFRGTAIRWSERDGLQGLVDFQEGIRFRDAVGVSQNGNVIVGIAFDGFQWRPIRWTQELGAEVLKADIFDEFPNSGFPIAVSGDGKRILFDRFRHGILWEDGRTVDIGDLPGGGDGSYPRAISADGTTVVGYGSTDIGGEAFRWTEASGMVALDLAPGGIAHSQAVDVNGDGSVVLGHAKLPEADCCVFLWTEEMGMRSLRSLLGERGVDVTGWQFGEAIAISDDGLVVVGNGLFLGKEVAWYADLRPIPEPQTTVLLFSGLVCFATRRQTPTRKFPLYRISSSG